MIVPIFPLFQSEQLPLLECNLLDKKTKAPALLTEATLLGMMEACGKEIDDEDEREAIKTLGIGTPATRAAIIENLLSKGMILREKKSLLPTPKGLEAISLLTLKAKPVYHSKPLFYSPTILKPNSSITKPNENQSRSQSSLSRPAIVSGNSKLYPLP